MIHGKIFRQGDNLQDAFFVREQVFVNEQKVPKDHEFDEWDEKAIHAVAYDEQDQPVATGRLILDDDFNFLLGRIAVLKAYRKQKYGDFIVRLLLDQAFQCAASEVFIHAQVAAVPFYETIGFHSFGEPYMEENIAHISMSLKRGEMKTECANK